MDEPLSALDPQLREELRLQLREAVAASELACVYVTHDQEEALAMADVVALMNVGEIVEWGPPAEVFERPRTQFAARFLGARNSITVAVNTVEGQAASGTVSGTSQRATFTVVPGVAVGTGSDVNVVWRPSAAHIAASSIASAANCWPGEVVGVLYLGSYREIAVRLFDRYTVVARTRTQMAKGDTCWLELEQGDALGYPVVDNKY
jgi:ABC-type Fe3+/spermidine/putrescine transport system ATPase subunit